jgi:hypothetical protein
MKRSKVEKSVSLRARALNPAKFMIARAKNGARIRGLGFNLVEADILPLPKFCPVLGVELNYTPRGTRDNWASIDRFDNSKGYVKDNVCVISLRANELKRNATVEEMRGVLAYMTADPTTLKPSVEYQVEAITCETCGKSDFHVNGVCRPCLKAKLSKRQDERYQSRRRAQRREKRIADRLRRVQNTKTLWETLGLKDYASV